MKKKKLHASVAERTAGSAWDDRAALQDFQDSLVVARGELLFSRSGTDFGGKKATVAEDDAAYNSYR